MAVAVTTSVEPSAYVPPLVLSVPIAGSFTVSVTVYSVMADVSSLKLAVRLMSPVTIRLRGFDVLPSLQPRKP